MSWFKKQKPTSSRYWEVYPQFRWHRVASGYDAAKEAYIFLTEPVLQYKASEDEEWRKVSLDVDIMTPVKAPNA